MAEITFTSQAQGKQPSLIKLQLPPVKNLVKAFQREMPVAEQIISPLTLEEITATIREQDPGNSYFSLQVLGLSKQCYHLYSTTAVHHNTVSRS